MSEVKTLLKVQVPCHKSTNVARTPLKVQSRYHKWLGLMHVLAVKGGSFGVGFSGECSGVETGGRPHALESMWFLASAKPGMSLNISRPTS